MASLLLVAACSDDDDDEATATESTASSVADTAAGTTVAGATSAAGGGDACVTAAEEFLAPYDELPTELPPDFTPLSKAPAPGGSIINLSNGSIPSDVETADEMVTAAESIGWTASRIIFDGTVEDLNVKFQQAVDQQPTVIAMAGFPVAAVQNSIDSAKAAGIIVSLASIADPVISNPGFAALSNGPDAAKVVEEVDAYLMLRDSACAGHVLTVTAPFPILAVGEEQFDKTITENCPNCKISELEVQPTDIGSPALTNQIVSKVQSDPSITHIHATFGNLAIGLDTALSQANISGIKIFGLVPDSSAVAALQNGTNAWWLTQSSRTQAWGELDAALRVLDTGDVATTKSVPFGVLTPENVDPNSSDVPSYPVNYRDLFRAIWLVA